MYCKTWPYCFNWQTWQIPIKPCHGLIIWWCYGYEHKYIQHLSCVFEVMLKIDHNPDMQVMGWNQKISCQNVSDEHSSVYNCKTVVGPSLFSNGIIFLQIFKYIKYLISVTTRTQFTKPHCSFCYPPIEGFKFFAIFLIKLGTFSLCNSLF